VLGAVLAVATTGLTQVVTTASTGAARTSYRVRPADLGKRISVKVTAIAHRRHTSTFSIASPRVG
jgi:hypothetical protein